MSSEPNLGLPPADGREPVITIQGLGKCYQIYERPQDRLKQMLWRGRRRFFKEFWALRDVSVSVQPGETVGVIGANGAGKSTLLKILAGLLEPTTGSVKTRGRVVALLELGTGFNPQFTGRQNLYLNAAILGLTQEEIDRRFPAIAAFAEIGEFMDQPVRTYSSGMAVRLAFAVMAHMDADVLIVDEALAVGDAYFVQRCMRFLRAFKERGTLFFVSHSTGAVVNLCHTALYLEHGRLIAQGNAKEVCEQYLADQHRRSSGDGPRAAWTPPPPLDIQALGRDPRQDLLAASNLRNDLQVFPFAPDQVSFGSASSAIFDAHLLNAQGEPVRWVIGGELVTLVVRAWARKEFINPVLGFFLKDVLGQRLFGDNTYFTYMDLTRVVEPEELLTARFTFRMPILRQGDYSIDVAVGEGTQETHVIHEWKYDALLLRSHASSLHTGLVGIPMGAIELDIQRREDRPAGHPEETVPDHDR